VFHAGLVECRQLLTHKPFAAKAAFVMANLNAKLPG